MRKLFDTAIILLVIFSSCNNNNTNQKATETTEVTEMVQKQQQQSEEMSTETPSALNNDWVNEIKLDNGNRWIANKETNTGVEEMIQTIEKSTPKTVADFHQLATQLNETKNFVVKECTMKGESHDNLHVFLHPLIDKIDALGQISTMDQGAEIKESINENLQLYHKYFE